MKRFVAPSIEEAEELLAKYMTTGTETGRLRCDRPNDLHTERAAKVFDVKLNEVTPEQRAWVKHRTFGFTYGMNFGGLGPAKPAPWTDKHEDELIDLLKRLRAAEGK